MKIFVKNTATGLVPLYDSDYDEKRKLKIGETYQCEIRKPRNIDFHKKFFALIRLGCENSPRDMPQDVYRAYVTMKAGFAEVYKTESGTMALPKSISFSNMDDTEFEKVYRSVLEVIMKDIDVDEEFIRDNLINFL